MPRTWVDTLLRTNQWKRGMRFGTWNVRSMHRTGSLTTVARELVINKLDLVSLQKVRWNKGVR